MTSRSMQHFYQWMSDWIDSPSRDYNTFQLKSLWRGRMQRYLLKHTRTSPSDF